MNAKRGRDGFTLIELLIVVIVIGVLAAIAVPGYSSAREKSFRAAMMSDLKNLAHHQEVYHNEHYTFSTDLSALGAQESDGVSLSINQADGTGWAATAVHEGLSSPDQCGIYHGDAPPGQGAPASEPSLVECNF